MSVRIIGDILEAFVVDLEGFTPETFAALSEDVQKQHIARAIGGLSGLGAERDLRIDSIEPAP